jgi:hypothetical protein
LLGRQLELGFESRRSPYGHQLAIYQACPVPQLGHATQVVTAAVKLFPQ